MTIHRLYAENGDRAGFWVQHRDWSNTCAQVQSISGQTAGALVESYAGATAAAVPSPAEASPASLNSPPSPASVLMHVFDVRSGRRLPDESVTHDPDDRNYARIAEPCWHHEKGRPYIPPRRNRAADRAAGTRRGGGR